MSSGECAREESERFCLKKAEAVSVVAAASRKMVGDRSD
jgi:hypothetical protein